jgi:hypothetical protein
VSLLRYGYELEGLRSEDLEMSYGFTWFKVVHLMLGVECYVKGFIGIDAMMLEVMVRYGT